MFPSRYFANRFFNGQFFAHLGANAVPSGYSQITLAQLAAQISSELEDSTNVFWSLDEIYRAINEALLYWGALTSYWRARASFTTSPTVSIYDLSSASSTSSAIAALRTRAYTFGQLANEIQYMLLEPTGGIAASTSKQFPPSLIGSILRNRRNEFAIDTHTPLTYAPFTISTTPSDGRHDMDDSVAAIMRASWADDTINVGATGSLKREDAWAADSYNPTWPLLPGVPFSYSTAETRPVQIQFIPPNANTGTINLIYVESLNLTITDNTSFAIPDEFVHALKYGCIYELLSTYNEGFDPIRAQYCLERYNQYLTVAAINRSLLRVQRTAGPGTPLPLDIFSNLDSFRPYWETRQGAYADYAATAFDLLALSPVAKTPLSINVDVVRTAPLPVLTTDYIQIGREELPYIIDFCRHMLSFKLASAEFLATMPLYDNFLKGAQRQNKQLADKCQYLTPLFGQPKTQSLSQPAA